VQSEPLPAPATSAPSAPISAQAAPTPTSPAFALKPGAPPADSVTPQPAQKNFSSGVETGTSPGNVPFDAGSYGTEVASAESPSPAAPLPASSEGMPAGQFAWPVQGTVISGFGPSAQGTNNDGVNIAAPKGAPVIAAAGGIVAYTGNEMKGFGNLVLIRHEGGWVTAYAHLERMTVAKDSVVGPGDMIGTVGTTGGIATPQLHFETRKDGTPVDPMTVLKK
jgi:murein DD-endopeptidase MepM/ murein hydrolase activator NlpD